MVWLIGLGQALVFGFASRYMAQEKGKDPTAWFWYGFLFGLIGFLAIALTPASRSADAAASPRGGTAVRAEAPKLVFAETAPLSLDLHSPVEIRELGLAIDDRTGMAYARAALVNLSGQIVTAVKFAITCYDSFGDVVGSTVESAFQDEYAGRGAVLRSRTPLQLFPAARKLDLQITRVAFSDGTMWEKGDYELATPAQQSITQADLGRLKRVAGNDAVGYALLTESHWVCVCGRHNLLAASSCMRCHRAKDDVLTKFNNAAYVDQVLSEQEERDAIEAVRQQQRAAAEAARRVAQGQLEHASRMQKAKIGIGIVALIIVAIVAIVQLNTYRTYRNGKSLLAAGRFDDARAVFAGLHGRYSAEQLMDDATYGKGLSLREAGRYNEALSVFKGVRNQAGLSDAVNETNYRKARSFFDAGEYAAAMKLFSTIPAHKDSRDYLAQSQERQYQMALGAAHTGYPVKALAAFAVIAGYKDSQTQIDELHYRDALDLMKAGRYETALPILQKMPAFRDSAGLAKECSYQLALSLHPAKPVITAYSERNIDGGAFTNQYKAYDLFRQLRGYKDVDAILQDAYYLHEIADVKWASDDGTITLDIGRPIYSLGSATMLVGWHGPQRIQWGGLFVYINTVKGNQLSDGAGPDSHVLTAVLLDPDTIRVTVDEVTATLTRPAK